MHDYIFYLKFDWNNFVSTHVPLTHHYCNCPSRSLSCDKLFWNALWCYWRCCLWLCIKNIFWKTLDVFLILTITILIIKFYKESITHQSKFWWSWSFLIFLFCTVLAINHIFNLWMESRSWTLERSFKGSGRWEQTWSFY